MQMSETQIKLHELRLIEELKEQVGQLFNYRFFKTSKELPRLKKFKPPTLNITIDSELDKLEHEYEIAQRESRQGLKRFRNAVLSYQQPESVIILKEKSEIERLYLQKTII